MRSLIRLALISVIMAGLFCTIAIAEEAAPIAAPQANGPLAVVKEPVHDFGSVYAGKDVIHAFEIQNTGNAPLIIQDVKTG